MEKVTETNTMNTIQEVFAALERMKDNLDELIENNAIKKEDVLEYANHLLKTIKKEINHFDDEDYSYELKTTLRIMDDFNELMETIEKDCKVIVNLPMNSLTEIISKLEKMRDDLEDFLAEIDVEKEEKETLDDIKELLKKIKEEINHFDEEDFEKELAKTLELEEEFKNFDLTIEKPHYYDFGYFFNNKDSGSCRVTLPFELDTDDVDECVSIAVANNALDEDFAANIIYVEELDEEEARNMGFDI